MSITTSNSSLLENGVANTKCGSQVQSCVAPEPDAYLRLDTGEVIGVPKGDVTELNNEFDKWNRLMHEQLLANEVLAVCDERLERIAQVLAENPKNPNAVPRATIEEAEKAQELAVQWRDKATENLRKELQPLDKLGSSGKKLVELVPLMEKEGDSPAKFERGKEDGEWKRDGIDLKKSWSFKSAVGLRDQMMQKARYQGVGPLRVVSSDKLKASWPAFKDKKAMKWSEVYKPGADGKRKIDRTRMRQYLGEQVTELKASSKDFIKLEIGTTGTLGPEALANWNANAHFSQEGKLVFGDTQLGDIDLSAEAAAMRYFTGGSLSGEIAPLKGNVNIKAEGSAEIAFAEGKAGASLFLPSKTGILLYLLDIKQIEELAQGKPMSGKPYDLGAIRLVAAAELKGVIGVSIAGEVSLGIEMKDVDVTDHDGQRKRGKQTRVNGNRKKGNRARAVDVTGNNSEWKDKAGLAAEVNLFAGASGGLELKGSLQWRNPHNEKKIFEVMASVMPQVSGQAGIGGSAKLAVEYVDGVFRITAHAGICIGLGAEGTFSFAVGAKQLASFVYWLYYNLLHVGFANLAIISEGAFKALKYLTYLLVCEGKKIGDYYLKRIGDLEELFKEYEKKYEQAQAAYDLGKRILANPEVTRFSPPETKGILIWQLTRHGGNSILVEPGLGSGYLRTQKQAILAILRQTQVKSDLVNVIRRIHPNAEKVTLEHNLGRLKDFFKLEGPGGVDFPGKTIHERQLDEVLRQAGLTTQRLSDARQSPSSDIDNVAMNGDFDTWYDEVLASLKDDATRGYMAVANNTMVYAMQRDGLGDHPLYDSTETGFYTRTA